MTSVACTTRVATGSQAPAAWLFAVAAFTSAALVFLVEPLIGKLLLPLLGGSPAIWNTSLAFFQAALLAGYAYAHLLQRLRSVRRQMAAHLLVLAFAALVLPLKVSGLLGEPWRDAPALWLAAVMTLSLGPPFAVLSATAPLLQAWYARLAPQPSQGRNAYALYAASNLGSLLALAAYPTVVEPLLGLTRQAQAWSWAYTAFAGLMLILVARAWRVAPAGAAVVHATAAPATPAMWRERAIWLLLSAAPASLLMGVTAHLTADIASVPFLWVIPLELYLLTFVIAFARRGSPPSAWLLGLQLVSVPASLILLFNVNTPWPQQVAIHLAAFFVTALVCHRTLASRRPDPSRLTEFYLWMSIGGVVGGGFNAFLAPLLFPGVWEYPAVLVLACLARPSAPAKRQDRRLGWLIAGLAWVAPLCIPALVLPDYLRAALLLAPALMAVMVRERAWAVALLYAGMALAGEVQGLGRYREHHRSFFGVVHITEVEPRGVGPIRIMVHGTTLHGAQRLAPARRCEATAYYTPRTLIGRVFQAEQARKPGLRMGAVGLGAGTVATFVRPSDSMRFFEIDPLIARLTFDPAYFSFVNGCAKGPVDVVLGDARLSMTREPSGAYDLILVDAFSSDSVPTHLLTVEALRGYLRLLAPGGVVLLHLSNRNLELVGPASAAARALGVHALAGEHWVAEGISPYVEAAGIVLLVAPDARSLERYRAQPDWKAPEPTAAWTDDRTNVWGAMIARYRAR